MEQFSVTGMSCAACQARVEKAVSKVPGVTSCSVSLLTNSMGVEGTASPEKIIQAVENAGYGAARKASAGKASRSGASNGDAAVHSAAANREGAAGYSERLAKEEDALRDKTTPVLKKRLIWSLIFLMILMYFSMGVHMWGWPVPAFMEGNHIAMGLMQLLLSGIIMVINQKFFVSGFKSLVHGAPNMDSTIALGSGAAFAYSTVMLFMMTRAQVDGGSEAAMPYMNEFYFESAGMILTLITVGKMLESLSKGRTTDALKSLMRLAPKTATLLRDGKEVTVSVDEILIGDVFVVRPGESIPADGVVLEGSSAVNESALTGESIPVDKATGSTVTSATTNQSGFLKCRATRVGEDTTLSQIISMVSDAAATKAPVAKLADRISAVFVPSVIGLSIFTIVIWLLLGQEVGYALARGICVLVVSCPCALGLATPVAIMVGNGMGAKNGILFKTAEALQETGSIQIVALDKTGTITNGTPVVTDLIPTDSVTADELIRKAAILESRSEHPLARAIVQYAAQVSENTSSPANTGISDQTSSSSCHSDDKTDQNAAKASELSDFHALPGNGLTGILNGRELSGGNARFIQTKAVLDNKMKEQAARLAEAGRTPMFFEENGKLLGIIAVADTLKEDSAQAIAELKDMGIHVVMITGDNPRTAAAIGRQAGVDEVAAGVLPDGKEEIIRQLQKSGKVAMVGDGINDAPALTRANIGIAIGAGTDVAIDSADVVLMKSRLTDVSAAVRLSRATYRNIVENLFWALFYNILLIPLAAGLYAHWGLTMNPMWGAAAMSCSSFFVCMNALRLNLFRMHDNSHDHRRREIATSSPLLKDSESKASDLASSDGVGENNDTKTCTAAGGKDTVMTKTMNIEGMMCCHCEKAVKTALEALEGVASAEVSHEKGTAVVTLSKDIEDALLKKAVEDKDYKVTSIQ